jgi:hypothetical protein
VDLFLSDSGSDADFWYDIAPSYFIILYTAFKIETSWHRPWGKDGCWRFVLLSWRAPWRSSKITWLLEQITGFGMEYELVSRNRVSPHEWKKWKAALRHYLSHYSPSRVFDLGVKMCTCDISCDKIEDAVISSKILVCFMKSFLPILAIEALWGEGSLLIIICPSSLNNFEPFVQFLKYEHWTVRCDVN